MRLSPQYIMHNNSSFPYRWRQPHVKKCFAIIHHLFNPENFFCLRLAPLHLHLNEEWCWINFENTILIRCKIFYQRKIEKTSYIKIERNYIQIKFLYHSVYLFCKTKAYKSSKYVYCGGCIECCSNYLFALKK